MFAIASSGLSTVPKNHGVKWKEKGRFFLCDIEGGEYRKLMWINLKEKEKKLEEVMAGSLHFPREWQREIYVPGRSRAEAEQGARGENKQRKGTADRRQCLMSQGGLSRSW